MIHRSIVRRTGAATPALIASGCAGPLSTLDAAGPAAANIAWLWWMMLIGSVLLTALVLTLLMLAFRRHAGKDDRGLSVWLGWLGVAMPSAVLLVLLGYALVLGDRTLARPAADVVTVKATGHQWFWTFRQPGAAGAIETRDTLHIPAGRPVNVHVSSADVIHAFWVPRLGGKMDAIPGQVNVLRIEASQPGTYQGQCAEFCGLHHASNRFRVIAHDPESWRGFQRGEQP